MDKIYVYVLKESVDYEGDDIVNQFYSHKKMTDAEVLRLIKKLSREVEKPDVMWNNGSSEVSEKYTQKLIKKLAENGLYVFNPIDCYVNELDKDKIIPPYRNEYNDDFIDLGKVKK